MKTIADLTSRAITPIGRSHRDEKVLVLTSELDATGKTSRSATYEIEVFNFLFNNKTALGIQSVIKFTNLTVDGQVVLANGRRLAIEVKLRMNWLKQCQAEWQFRHFLLTRAAKTNPVNGCIVFFEEFSGDWSRKSQKANNLWGWEGWYLYSRDAIDGKPMDLLMLCNGELQGYPG